ncbi:translation initiation factor IF-2-like [Hordeum vulgare subsp. vulgare]|uniref:translation initiation factor IF-2-like n=1 Tax=Hordeum vulgare subsp. vulgare TaxID=112509 RepID=UPI001D1A4EBB|nr:translation initiation factor IF-2-like [Hordeum vulgare subsp. vulgare]
MVERARARPSSPSPSSATPGQPRPGPLLLLASCGARASRHLQQRPAAAADLSQRRTMVASPRSSPSADLAVPDAAVSGNGTATPRPSGSDSSSPPCPSKSPQWCSPVLASVRQRNGRASARLCFEREGGRPR